MFCFNFESNYNKLLWAIAFLQLLLLGLSIQKRGIQEDINVITLFNFDTTFTLLSHHLGF